MSFPGGGRPSGVGRVDVAILMTASMSSLDGGPLALVDVELPGPLVGSVLVVEEAEDAGAGGAGE